MKHAGTQTGDDAEQASHDEYLDHDVLQRERGLQFKGRQYILKLQIGSRVFAPSWFGLLLTLLVVPALSSLGFWQLRRAHEKRDLMAQAEQGRNQVLPLVAANAGELNRYQSVSVSGRYDEAHQVLLDNMPSSHGEPGYRVLTPLLLEDQSLLLVDRGWLPVGKDRKQLPQLNVDTQARQLKGMLDELPRPGVRAGNAGVQPGVWPQRLNYPTYEELQQLYGTTLQRRIVLLDAKANDGFERIWQIDVGFTPERHIGYAVQWFGMALTVVIIFIVVNLRRIET
jgi:surfeit locus 1 family protein